MINIFIVDDHPLVVEGIQTTVGTVEDMQVVGSAAGGAEALAWLSEQAADVIILDISLPDQDGISLCRAILQQDPNARVIGLTTYEEVSFIRGMMKEGAKGYLFKTSPREKILAAIREVFQGNTFLSPEVNERLVAAALHQPRQQSFIPRLTRREKEVLALIVDERTNQEIADELCISLSTVETHRRHLCEKLGARNTAGLVRNAIKFGLDRG
jgi:DNA-binding NarL/FixJ family response regulator